MSPATLYLKSVPTVLLDYLNNMKIKHRNQLFFNQYRYSLQFVLRYSGQMRVLDRIMIMSNIYNYQQWRGVTNHSEEEIRMLNCLEVCDILQEFQDPFHRMCYPNEQIVYSNNLQELNRLARSGAVDGIRFSEAVVSKPQGVVQLKRTAHAYRSYFKENYLSIDQCRLLSDFLLAREDYFRITRELKRKLAEGKFRWLGRWQFIDHHSPADVLMLNMVVPGIIRETVPIETK